MRTATILMLLMALPVVADEPKPKPAGDLAELQGTWAVISSVFDGKPTSPDVAKQRKMILRENRLIAVAGGEQKGALTVVLDPDKAPKQIDLARPNGQGTARGIYALHGDELKLCYGEPGKDRPKAFTSPEGGRLFLLVLKREKP